MANNNMNYKETEQPTNCGFLSDNTISYQQRYNSPDSDSASTSSSVFSSDSKSSQSSPLSSPVKSERSWNGDRYQHVAADATNGHESSNQRTSIQINQLVNQEPWPVEQRPVNVNPRRVQLSSQSSVCQTQSRCPPQLTRQCDRTQNFVENLVDTSTQMIEVIWPLSISHCDKDYLGGKNLIGLRTFIQEVLKRSKTSYYTLQVALYYLVLIKPCVPKVDFTKQQTEATHAQRAMQCGRRMFLASLILASKYLQDRNYSARAWSKISGLKISEINSNEMAFVTAVNWKLHIPEPQFQKWANIVYKYSTSQSASLPLNIRNPSRMTWRQIVPRLTPELDEVDIEKFSRLSLNALPCAPVPQAQSLIELTGFSTLDGDKTPTPVTVNLVNREYGHPPHSPRIPALPTPAMTPQIQGFCTPAARTWSNGQAMRETMQKIQQEAFKSTSFDTWPQQGFLAPKKPLTRVLSNVSIISSPESMVSDITTTTCSSRTSRSSSISSTVSSAGALSGSHRMNPPANHRSALSSLNGSQYIPTCIAREPCIVRIDDCSVDNAEMDATLALLNLARTKSHGKPEHGQKRARPLSIADNNVSEEVRRLLAQSFDAHSKESTVLPDNRQANSFALSNPSLVENIIHNLPERSFKKQKSHRHVSPWASSSPSMVCTR